MNLTKLRAVLFKRKWQFISALVLLLAAGGTWYYYNAKKNGNGGYETAIVGYGC